VSKAFFTAENTEIAEVSNEKTLCEPGGLCGEILIPFARTFIIKGLASEMAGDERTAVKSYRTLWRDFPDSPFAILGRMKLEEK